jgi:acetyl esterase/lipase
MIYRGMDQAALDAAYNNGAAVGEVKRQAYAAERVRRSDAFRAAHTGRVDVAYGPGARQRLDIHPCGRPGAPTLVFVHGGYWQANDKEPMAYVGAGLLPAGFHLVNVEYTLAPAARLDAIVAEVRAAVAWTIEHAKEWGGDPARVFVSGNSAGGHLTAMAMDDPRLAGGVAISGLFDLEPIRLSYLNAKLRLDAAEAERNSPLRHLPARAGTLVVTVGLDELPELIRQSEEFAKAWLGRGLPGRYLPLAGHDHFSIVDELARPDGALVAALRAML